MLGIAELVAIPFLLTVLAQWARAERAQAAVLDRRLDGELFSELLRSKRCCRLG
jgi:putative copper resistance protein D